MANTSIIHCGSGRERMEVDFYAKLDWQLSPCPLYLRGWAFGALPLIAWLAQSNPAMFAIKAVTANSIWGGTSHTIREKYVISLNPYSFLKSEQDGIFAKLIGSKCNSKVAEPYLILHRGWGQALIFQCYGFSVGGNHISYQQYTVEYAEYTVEYTEYTGISHWNEPMVCHEWKSQSNFNYCRIPNARRRHCFQIQLGFRFVKS